MPSLEIQIATLVVAGLAVIATLVGIYVNAQGQNDLAKKVRRYQVHDRDLEDFRRRFQIVSELTDALHKTKDNYVELSAESKHEPFDESSYEKLYASINPESVRSKDYETIPTIRRRSTICLTNGRKD
ncbi:MAG: hypothetical protein ACC700_17150 [Anaerolineales bacterium]